MEIMRAAKPADGLIEKGGGLLSCRKGQASLSDSLYFLLIVSGLAAFLFYFAANYGNVLEQQVVRQYQSQYATSALETILYTSTPRIPGETLDNATEVDYLLAAVKEDYADDKTLDDTNTILADSIDGIMQPFRGSFDYTFYLYAPEKKQFIYMLMSVSGADFEVSGTKVVKVKDVDRESLDRTRNKRMLLFCAPSSLDDVEEIMADIGATSQSNARMQMIEIGEGGVERYPIAQVNLTMWLPTAMDLAKFNCDKYR